MFRNFFVAFCVLAVVLAFILGARPDLLRGLMASRPSEPETTTANTILVLPAPGRGAPSCTGGTDVRQIIDFEEEGVPSRANPYIMVLNTTDKTIRYYRLTPRVASVTLRKMTSEVTAKSSRVLNSNGPVQLEVWTSAERELTFDVRFQAPR